MTLQGYNYVTITVNNLPCISITKPRVSELSFLKKCKLQKTFSEAFYYISKCIFSENALVIILY